MPPIFVPKLTRLQPVKVSYPLQPLWMKQLVTHPVKNLGVKLPAPRRWPQQKLVLEWVVPLLLKKVLTLLHFALRLDASKVPEQVREVRTALMLGPPLLPNPLQFAAIVSPLPRQCSLVLLRVLKHRKLQVLWLTWQMLPWLMSSL